MMRNIFWPQLPGQDGSVASIPSQVCNLILCSVSNARFSCISAVCQWSVAAAHLLSPGALAGACRRAEGRRETVSPSATISHVVKQCLSNHWARVRRYIGAPLTRTCLCGIRRRSRGTSRPERAPGRRWSRGRGRGSRWWWHHVGAAGGSAPSSDQCRRHLHRRGNSRHTHRHRHSTSESKGPLAGS